MGFQPVPVGWSLEPSILIGLLGAAGLFAYRRRTTPSREDGNALYFWLGLATFGVALVSPLDAVSDRYLVSAHMLQHILITMVGPPLLLAGAPDIKWLARWRVNPWFSVVVFNFVLMVWHLPAFYDATLREPNLHVLEHLMFMATAFVFWWPVIGPGSRGATRLSPLMKIGYLAFAGVPPTVVGFILALAPVPLYPFYAAAPRLLSDVSAALDQQLAGILMFGLGNLIYFVPVSWIFFHLEDREPVAAHN
jgi:putative membrane protein